MQCQACCAENPDEYRFCGNCGIELSDRVDEGKLFQCPLCKVGEIHQFKFNRALQENETNIYCNHCTACAVADEWGQYKIFGWENGYTKIAPCIKQPWEYKTPAKWQALIPYILSDATLERLIAGEYRILPHLRITRRPITVRGDERILFCFDATLREELDRRGVGGLSTIAEGVFVLTNKRYVFTTSARNISINLAKVLDITIDSALSNGSFSIAREGKQRKEFYFAYPAIVINFMLAQIMRDAGISTSGPAPTREAIDEPELARLLEAF